MSVVTSLIEGLVIAALVLVFFFGEWKSSFIIGVTMPISVLAALILMAAFDMSINLMSLGGLVVGNAAVEAHIVSPAVLIAVAIAGVAGYTMPSQDMAAALRLWRFLLAILASLGGLFGLAMGCAALICHLAGLESFGVPYLAPFTSAAGQERGSPDLIRLPLPWMKWRNGAARSANRRNQR